MDYKGLYEDLLEMIHRAKFVAQCGSQLAVNREDIVEFLIELREFQVNLLLRHYNPMGRISVY